MKYQVTIYNPENKYKPISTIVDVAAGSDKQFIITQGIIKICVKRFWTKYDLKKWGYTKVKHRIFDEN